MLNGTVSKVLIPVLSTSQLLLQRVDQPRAYSGPDTQDESNVRTAGPPKLAGPLDGLQNGLMSMETIKLPMVRTQDRLLPHRTDLKTTFIGV
jgi:hypothetical protein